MRRDGRPFLDGSETPRRFSDVIGDREPTPTADKDDAPLIGEVTPRQLRGNKTNEA